MKDSKDDALNGLSVANALLFDGEPSLPLKTYGELWHTGWDIPTNYAIDADNKCWADNAHGGSLCLVSANLLISQVENETTANDLRKVLGMKIPMPRWAEIALSQGWAPPENWKWQ